MSTATSNKLIDELLELSEGDSAMLTIDSDEYTGQITHRYRQPAEREVGIPVKGEFHLEFSVDNETVEKHNLGAHHVEIRVTERSPDRWEQPKAITFEPIIEDGVTVGDETVDLGEIEGVKDATE